MGAWGIQSIFEYALFEVRIEITDAGKGENIFSYKSFPSVI